jgi:hypothetical protein
MAGIALWQGSSYMQIRTSGDIATPAVEGPMPVLTAKEFDQDIAGAKRAADEGPMVLTDSGIPCYVFMRHETYQRLTERGQSLRLLLAHPESEDVEFDPPRLGDQPVSPASSRCSCWIPMLFPNSAGQIEPIPEWRHGWTVYPDRDVSLQHYGSRA